VYVGLAGAIIAAFYRVVEEAEDGVAVVLVVFCRVDATLRGDGMRPAGGILVTERFDVVAQFRQRCRRRSARQPRADHDDGELALVGRVDQLHVELMPGPLLGQGPLGYF